jgi:hypothetical protein
MGYIKKKNKLTLVPEIPEDLKWFNTGFFVLGSISLILGMLGGLYYLLNPPSRELLMFIGGNIFLGLIMLFLVSVKSIQDKLQTILQSPNNTIVFTEKSIVFKDVRENSIEKVILSSELTRIDIQEKKQTKPILSIGHPIPTNSFIYTTKIKVVILNLKDDREEIIQLEGYANTQQDQNNLVSMIYKYCTKIYSEVELVTTIID